MKRKLIYSLIIALSGGILSNTIPVFAIDNSFPVEKSIEIEKSWGTEDDEKFVDMKNTSDNGFITVAKNTKNILITKYDKYRNVEWEKNLSGSKSNDVQSVTQLNNGNFLVLGYTNSEDGDFEGQRKSSDGFMFVLDEYGNVINKIMLSGNGVDLFGKAVITSDGGFIVSGKTTSTDLPNIANSSGSNINFLRKYDKDFNIVWTNTDFSSYSVTSVKETLNGGIIVTATGDSDSMIYKLNYSGVKQWNKWIPSNGRISVLKSSLVLPNGDFVAVGYDTYTNSSGKAKAMLLALDTNGNIIADKKYNTTFNNNDYIYEITETENGYYLVGKSNSTNADYVNKGGYDGLIIEIDKNYELINTYNWGGSNSDTINCAIVVNGDMVYGASSRSSFDNYQNKKYDDVLLLTNGKKTQSSKPTINVLPNGKIELIDNNSIETQKDMYYRMNHSGSDNDGWIKYTEPFLPIRDASGNVNLEVKSINVYNLDSEIQQETGKFEPEKLTNSQGLDISFEKADTLKLELSTNTIDFGTVDGLIDKEFSEPVVVKVSSSLPWDMTIQALDDFKGQKNPENIVTADKLEVKTDDSEYKALSKERITLLENQPDGENSTHNLKFKLKAVPGLKADIYKLPTKINILQK
jgi:hypothetical protein